MERVRANRAAYAALATCSNEEVAQVGLLVSSAAMIYDVVFASTTPGQPSIILGFSLN